MRRRLFKSDVKAPGLTWELRLKLEGWSVAEGGGIPRVAVKCVEMWRNTNGDAASWASTDAHARKRGEQTGLDTLVVHALNDVDWLLGRETSLVTKLTREVDRLGSTAARLKLKGIDGDPHKRWIMWINSMQREKPYLPLTCPEAR